MSATRRNRKIQCIPEPSECIEVKK